MAENGVVDRLYHAWNVFRNRSEADDREPFTGGHGVSYGVRPGMVRRGSASDKSIVASVYNRMGVDAASSDISHVRLDDNRRYKETIYSALNDCLNVEANIDQAGRAFRQDIYQSLFEHGTIAIVPTDYSIDPKTSVTANIYSLRVGYIVNWFAEHVVVSLWNEKDGRREELVCPKRRVAIVENPFYTVMNEPNSTLQRLIKKLGMLDSIDEQTSSGKLDLIIQLPYVIKTETKRQQAETRRKDIENQLKGSQYGIAYTDGTERITQLNRPAENNMLAQIKELTAQLYNQLGLTQAVFDGTADEAAMINYQVRTIEPIVTSVVQAMERSFLTKTARSQLQAIRAFRSPFKFLTISQIGEVGDKLTRNEILSSNELRSEIGYKPSADPKADELRNKNLPVKYQEGMPAIAAGQEGDYQNGT